VDLSKMVILWDLDGTIVDSTECHYKTWALTLEKHGFSLSREKFKAHYGKNTKTALPIYLGFDPDPTLAENIQQEKEALFRQIMPKESQLVPGVISWLAAADDAGFKQAIASSAGMKNITTMLSAFNLLSYFDSLVSGANLPAKPQPDVFLAAADQLNQLPENCLVIEDSTAGVEAAKKAGMTCIAVLTSHSKSQLASADLVIEDFNEPFTKVLHDLGIGDQPVAKISE